MRTAIVILSYYTIVVIMFTIVIPSLSTAATGNAPLSVITQFLSFLPVMDFALMVVLETMWRFSRAIMAILAGYTAVVFLYYIYPWFTPPLDPSQIFLASLYVPIVIFAGLVLVAQRRNAI